MVKSRPQFGAVESLLWTQRCEKEVNAILAGPPAREAISNPLRGAGRLALQQNSRRGDFTQDSWYSRGSRDGERDPMQSTWSSLPGLWPLQQGTMITLRPNARMTTSMDQALLPGRDATMKFIPCKERYGINASAVYMRMIPQFKVVEPTTFGTGRTLDRRRDPPIHRRPPAGKTTAELNASKWSGNNSASAPDLGRICEMGTQTEL